MSRLNELRKKRKLLLFAIVLTAALLIADIVVFATTFKKTNNSRGSFDPSSMFGSGDFDPSSMFGSGNFDPSTMFGSGDFDPSTMFGSGDFDPSTMFGQGGFQPGGRTGNRNNKTLTERIICIVLAVVLTGAEIFFVIRYRKTEQAIYEEKQLLKKKKNGKAGAKTVAKPEEPEKIVDPVELRKKKQKRDRIALVSVLGVAAAVVITLIVLGRDSKPQQTVQVNREVREATVKDGSIGKNVKGSGTIDATEEKIITIPGSISLMQYYVAEGDIVAEGDKIAAVEMNSVKAAIGNIESTMEKIDSEIMTVKKKATDAEILAPAKGRIVKIYAETGRDVIDVMYDYGSLMVLSLDGLLATDIPNSGSFTNDTAVLVTDGDGNEYSGMVSAIRKDSVTITVSMDDFTVGEAVSVRDENGNLLQDNCILYVLNGLNVTGYSGSVDEIKVSVNDTVAAKDVLITLSNTDYTATYQSLLNKRETLEKQYNELVKIANTGYLYASNDGIVTGIYSNLLNAQTTSGIRMGNTNDYTVSDTTVCTLIPNSQVNISLTIDELDINHVALGQTVEVTLDAIQGQSFTGTVTGRGSTGTNNGGNTKYTVTVTMDKTEKMLLGMNASVVIPLETTENIPVIPEDAIVEENGHAYVYTAYDEKNDRLFGLTEIKTGLSDGTNVEITEGLTNGQKVYYSYAGTISYRFIR